MIKEIIIAPTPNEGISALFNVSQVLVPSTSSSLARWTPIRQCIPVAYRSQEKTKIRDEYKDFSMDLPCELVLQVLLYTIKSLLRQKCFKQACKLMMINKPVLRRYHLFVTGGKLVGNISDRRKIIRLSRTIHFAYGFYLSVIVEDNTAALKHFMFQASTFTHGPNAHQVEPWQFLRRHGMALEPIWDLVSIEKPFVQHLPLYESVVVGKKKTDIVWLLGHQGEKYFHYLGHRTPVFIICLTDAHEELLNILLCEDTWDTWVRFAGLLKWIYGDSTGVFVVYGDRANMDLNVPLEIAELV